MPLSFTEVHQSLSLGVVDCAITGPSSANSSSWPEVTTHQYALGVQMAVNAYAITLKAWKRLSPEQQAKMQAAFTELTNDIWSYSEVLTRDAMNCNAGKEPCTTGKKYNLVDVPVQEADLATLRGAVASISVPTWAEICDKSNPGCSTAWKNTVGKVVRHPVTPAPEQWRTKAGCMALHPASRPRSDTSNDSQDSPNERRSGWLGTVFGLIFAALADRGG
ncbi:MAG: hypothetical protein R3E42_00245 [Burkholderiaceae bacterium]